MASSCSSLGLGKQIGAGRRTFEVANGWGGNHAWGPAFVLAHEIPDGWPRPDQRCLNAGLLDEIHIDLAAVLLDSGVRLFDHLADTPVVLGSPTVVAGVGVTHLRYPVREAQYANYGDRRARPFTPPRWPRARS